MKKKLITWSNATTVALALLMIVIVISPQAKAIMLQGLMKIGFFKPPVKNTEPKQRANGSTNLAPGLVLRTADGKSFDIKDQKGKVLFINFWATWCPPCIAEMPSINEMYARYKRNRKVMILEVDVDGNFSKSEPFMKKNNYQLPVYNMVSEPPEGFLSEAIPTTVIIDKTGVVVARHEGGADYTDKAFYKYLDGLIDK
ncbi:TlpA disulfide reductase family protein [Mucilaginibacter sp. UR6-11]|uniref:TlpA family protein disulfide reductase n=1 Tax=Mucilaginibacter sp. UR6-11 TaxID=1435644 RepID=UPI001E2EAF06|nr:TlpA disulfide reductase family protein [Mucilaginibacter sp. UR6-11]MCC8427203.1 TlpA family protein disulfide reductase [Mucilaginibacter sp. UR6-11]